MLATVIKERQDDLDLHVPHVEFAYNNAVSAATGLAPNEVHMGRLPRLLLTVFDRTGVVGHQSLTRDHLAYCDLATYQQKRANDLVRAHHALTFSRVNQINSALADALRPAPFFATDGVAWVYDSASTIRQGAKANTDAKVLKAKLALNWTSTYKIRAVGPCSAAETPDGSPLGSNLLYLEFSSDLPGSDARQGVAIERFKPCVNRHDRGDMPKYLPAGLTLYVLNNVSKKSPPYHVTQYNVLDLPPTAGGGADHWSSVGTGARWRHRGAIQDALDGTLRTFLGEGNGPPPLAFDIIEPEPRINIAKPTASTVECGSGRHSASSPATTGNVSYRQATSVFSGPICSVATTTQYFLSEPTFDTKETMG